MGFLKVALVSISSILLVIVCEGQPTYLGCDRTIDSSGAPGAACGTSTDVLQCSSIMSSTPATNGDFLSGSLPTCVLPGAALQLSFQSNLNVMHADTGTITNENKCTVKSQSILSSNSGFNSAEWTAPGTDANVTFLFLFAGGFGQVTMQETTLQVQSSCSAAPTSSPSAAPPTVPTPSPSNAPTVLSAAMFQQNSVATVVASIAVCLALAR